MAGFDRLRARPPARHVRQIGLSLLCLLFLFVAGLWGLQSLPPQTGVRDVAGGLAPPRPPTDPRVREAVQEADRVAAGMDGSTVAVAVLDRASGEVVGGAHAGETMYTASVVKLFVVLDVVQRRHHGTSVSAADEDLIRRALGPSDDDAMNALWDRFDGQGAVSRVAARYGLAETRPPERSGDWGDTRSSARDVVTVLGRAAELPSADRDLVVGAMENAPRTAFGGFDQAFGLRAGSARVAAKAGWMCCTDGRVSMHSTGLLGPDERFAVAVLSTQPSSSGYSGARDGVSEVAAPILGALG